MKNQRGHCGIDDEVIELQAMGRLQDLTLLEHLDTCEDCVARVHGCRAYIADLKQALRDLTQVRMRSRHTAMIFHRVRTFDAQVIEGSPLP